MNAIELVEACEHYLGSMGITIWGQAFDVIDDKRRHDGALWLAKQIQGVLREAEKAE